METRKRIHSFGNRAGTVRDQYLPSQLLHFLQTLGSNKLVWGTGYPFMTHAGPLEDAKALNVSSEARDAFLWGNAARIWGFE